MLRSVSLVNFQSHQSTRLELGRFTVVIGSSSSGKSAVVRAIRLVAENARGVTYVRQGAKQARVSLEFAVPDSEGSTVVSTTRGKNVSEYELALPGSDPSVFTKCGTTVPEALAEVMGFGDSRLWLAGQFDRPFLLDETGSAVAQVLGRLTNVTMIFSAVRECNRRASEANKRVRDRKAELAEVRESLRPHAGLPDRLAAGRAAEEACDAVSIVSSRRVKLSDLLVSVTSAGRRATMARAAVHAVPDVSELSALAERRSRLLSAVDAVVEAQSRRDAVSSMIRPVPEVGDLALTLENRARLSGALAHLAQACELRLRLAGESSRAAAVAADAKERFSVVLARAGSCPLCGASAAHAQIDRVV